MLKRALKTLTSDADDIEISTFTQYLPLFVRALFRAMESREEAAEHARLLDAFVRLLSSRKEPLIGMPSTVLDACYDSLCGVLYRAYKYNELVPLCASPGADSQSESSSSISTDASEHGDGDSSSLECKIGVQRLKDHIAVSVGFLCERGSRPLLSL